MAGCRLTLDLGPEPATGLVRLPTAAWDVPDEKTWWVEALVTWSTIPPRSEMVKLPVRVLAGGQKGAVDEARRLLTKMCAVSALVRWISPPMTTEQIMRIQEANAALVKARRTATGKEQAA